MSREELIGAYTGGRLSRRAFVRGLVVLGVSAGAAVAYADSLAAAPSSRPSATSEVYPEYPGSTTTTAAGAVGAGQVGAANSGAAQSAQAHPRFTG